MSGESVSGITELLLQWNRGDEGALDRLMPLVYDDLRNVARRRLAVEDRCHTLQSAALVNETYLRLVDQRRVQWRDRTHFFAISARMMRRILVDHARNQRAEKRGGTQRAVYLDLPNGIGKDQGLDLVALDEALDALSALDPQQAQGIELRFFGGLTTREIADALGVSTATVTRDLVTAKAWLFERLFSGAPGQAAHDA
jgi:RNA polymerase sigma factor (TIGR02999 family)